MPSKRGFAVIVPALLLLLWPTRPARATGQVRMYFDVQGVVLHAKKSPLQLSLFGREESRFWSDGLQYVKTSAGVRGQVLRWLLLAAYYAHQDFVKAKPTPKHLAVADVIFHRQLLRWRVSERNEFEWHVTDQYFRYRAQVMAGWTTPVRLLSVWGSAELRVDSDSVLTEGATAGRVNMYDLFAGLSVRLSRVFVFQPFYGYEATRRCAPGWSGTHFLGLLLAVRSG